MIFYIMAVAGSAEYKAGRSISNLPNALAFYISLSPIVSLSVTTVTVCSVYFLLFDEQLLQHS